MSTLIFSLPIVEQLTLSVSYTDKIITGTYFQSGSESLLSSDSPDFFDNPFGSEIQRELEAYFRAGEQFSVCCALQSGTVFQQKVWRCLLAIPAGEVRTYGALAKELNSSARAVGNACRQNRFPVFVPCHRVVSASGIGGYAGDTLERQKGSINFLKIKQWLLAHEHAHI